MASRGVPLTRENYLNAIYMGRPPMPLPAEEEMELPAPFRAPAD